MKQFRLTERTFRTLVILVVVIVAIRLMLPYVILHFANKELANTKGYYGEIKDIDLALIRGAYTLDSVYLNKIDSTTNKQVPLFSAEEIDLSIEWKALLHGSIVGEVVMENPVIAFTREKVEPETFQKDSSTFKKIKEDFMPLEINRFEINNGNIRYRDEGSKPPVDIAMTEVHMLAQNLRNSYDSSVLLPARVQAHARVYGGMLTANLKLNPLANSPTFDLNTELKNTNLTELNEFFQAYAKIDVNKGSFGMYAEVAAKDERFTGYVKPLLKDLDVLGKEDRKDNIFRKVWEGTAGAAGEILENQPKDQLATKIPFEGKLKDPNTNVWLAIQNVLVNAFIQALQPAIDNEINITSVERATKEKKTLLQKIFSKKEKKVKS